MVENVQKMKNRISARNRCLDRLLLSVELVTVSNYHYHKRVNHTNLKNVKNWSAWLAHKLIIANLLHIHVVSALQTILMQNFSLHLIPKSTLPPASALKLWSILSTAHSGLISFFLLRMTLFLSTVCSSGSVYYYFFT